MSFGFIFFFQAPGAATDTVQLQQEILQQGFALRLFSEPYSLCRHLEMSSNPVDEYVHASELGRGHPRTLKGGRRIVVLVAAESTVCEIAQRIRATDDSISIVALLPKIDGKTVTRTLSAGVDVCWREQDSPQLLGRSLARLLGSSAQHSGSADDSFALDIATGHKEPFPTNASEPAATSAGGVWKLEARGWRICTPCGNRIALTTAERNLLRALTAAAGQRLTHQEMLREVTTDRRPLSDMDARRLTVLMSRLRRKFVAVQADLPFRSVRGVGYELNVEFVGQYPPEGRHASQPCCRDA